MCHRHRFTSIFPALRANILGRIRSAQDQDVFIGKLPGFSKVMGMQNTAIVVFKTFIMRKVWDRKVSRRHDNMIKIFCSFTIKQAIAHGDIKAVTNRANIAHKCVKLDSIPHPSLFHTTHNIIQQHGTRRVRSDRFAKMFFKAVVREFQPLFGTIRPKVTIHRPVTRIAMFIGTSPPRILPQTTPISLLFIAHDFHVARNPTWL